MRIASFVLIAAFIVTPLALPLRTQADAVNPLLLVDPFLGTSVTPDGSDVIDDFPGADVPFGMLQWSPDTPSQNAGGGYEYNDKAITGFSLTHLSGPGCGVFGDFSILPTTGVVSDPAHAKQAFSHSSEQAAPGWYAVSLGNPAIRAEIAVTKRTGLGAFTFPSTAQANLLVNVSSDQAGVRNAGLHVMDPHTIGGFADTGGFCGMPDRYSVYFAAQFDAPIVSYGTWRGSAITPGARSVHGAGSGGWVTFDTSRNHVVKMKVAVSFVDEAGALRNLRAENRGWDLVSVRNAAAAQWQKVLQRVQITGGTGAEQREFYTALYHMLLHPNVFSDADGRYRGYDQHVHRVRPGHLEYANFSDWDIYRTLVPLQALIAPDEVGDMMQSLVDAAQQDVYLPRWSLVNGATSVMGGDSVDPVIAGAYAFGARDFDVRGALRAMVKGATNYTSIADGWYVERPELADYLQRGYIVNTHITSVSPVPNGASETLEYALDDFSIAQLAHSAGNGTVYREFMRRSSNWAHLMDTSTGWIVPRAADGAFMQTPITDAGQSGFQEGNGAQYTWMVPQDLRDLVAAMGGRAAARAKLDAFFTQLNGGQSKPYAWLGNEPSLGSPYAYLTAGAPWREEQIVRQAMTGLYADSPHGMPGNDDLGTMSAWWLWSAMGLYPQNPSVRVLDVGSPLFTRVTLRSPRGPVIEVRAPQASDAAPFVQSLSVNGVTTQRTWIALPMRGIVRIDFTLGATPNETWGAAPQDAPPSYAIAPVHFPASTTASLVGSRDFGVSMPPNGSGNAQFTIDNTAGSAPVSVSWSAAPPQGIALSTQAGSAVVDAGSRAGVALHLISSAAAPGLYDIPITAHAQNGALLETLELPVLVQIPGQRSRLAYVANRFDNTVTPFDPRTGATGLPIAVGQEPRDGVFSRDERFVYVADRAGKSVSVIDTAAQRVAATIAVGQSPNGLALTPDGKTLWVANYDDDTIQAIDTATNKSGKPIATGHNPRWIAFAPDGKTMYVSNQGANTVTPYAYPSMTAAAPIPVGAIPTGIAITADGKTALVANSGTWNVTPIDLTTNTPLAPIPAGADASMIAISPDGRTAFVSNFGTRTVTPIDVAARTSGAPITVGLAPYGIAFSPDSKAAYVVLRADSALVKVDVAAGRAGAPIALRSTSPYTLIMP